MIRWGSVAVLVLLSGAVVGLRAEHCALIRERPIVPMIPNPFGGAPIAAQLKGLPGAGIPPESPIPPPVPGGPRPIRPVYTLPGPAKLDRHGDPLPSGAVVRYGTVRLRHGTDIQAMAFTHDGKLLCTVSASEDSVKLWDTATGKEVARLNTPTQLVGLTKDGFAVLVDDARVRVWQYATNVVRDLPEKTLPEGATATALAVNPDSRSFAIATNGKVLVIDIQTGKTLKELNLPGLPQNNGVAPGALAPLPPPGLPGGNPPPVQPAVKLMYSPDGRWLVGNGQKTGVWLWDLRTGKRVRTYRTEADFPEYTFSPDVTKIAVTGERLHLYPLDSEEPVENFKGPPNVPLFAPRFSADGKTILAIQPDSSITLLDAATGEEKEEGYDPPEMNLRAPFALAPGGTMAAAMDQTGGIRIWDPKTGKGPEVSRLPMLLDPGLSADGKSATILDQTNKLHTFDLATGAPGKVIELPIEEDGLPATWDAVYRRAAAIVPSGEELEVHVIDADTGKVVSKHSVPQNGGLPLISFASANRDRLAIFTQTGVNVVNPTTGKAVRSFNPNTNADNGIRGAISPDGRLVAVTTQPLTIWEVATGKKRLTVDAVPRAEILTFSADSRFVAAWDQTGNVILADVRTGTVARRFQHADGNEGLTALAISRDGKRIAAGAPTGRVTVWDVATGDTLAPFAGHDGAVMGMVFTSDGKKLVTAAQDGTALVWEIPDKPLPTGPVEAAVTGFDEAFRLLGSADAAQAQRGLDYLYRHPADAVKQAGERIPTPTATPAEKLKQFVADLDSEDFPTREAAAKALEKVGGEASALLKDAVQKSPSAEVRKLAAELLGKIDAPATRAEDMRLFRVVEAVENLRTPEACALLEKWATGPAGHRLTIEAAAALARLKTTGGK